MVLDCWTDGSSINNHGGWAFLIKNGNEPISEASGRVDDTTNNMAELIAIQRVLRTLPLLDFSNINEVKIYTDSRYAIGVIDFNYKIYKNKELIQEIKKDLAELRKYIEINFIYIKRRKSVECKFVDFSANQQARKLSSS